MGQACNIMRIVPEAHKAEPESIHGNMREESGRDGRAPRGDNTQCADTYVSIVYKECSYPYAVMECRRACRTSQCEKDDEANPGWRY